MSEIALRADGSDRRDLARWGLSFALIVVLHGAVLAGLVATRNLSTDQGEALPAVMVDMAPPPAAPTLAAADLPPAQASPEAARPDAVPDAVPDKLPDPEPPVPPPDMPQPVVTADVPPPPEPPPPEVEEPPPPRPTIAQKAEVALPPPAPKPKPAPPKPKERVVGTKPPRPVQAKRAERQEAERPPAQASGARNAAAVASLSSGASAASRSSWQGALVAALNRAKRPQSDTGSASVRFSIDRGGRLLSASLAGSAGVGSLDQEAVALVRRASLPPAPADVPGATFTFTIPIRFTTR